MSPVSKRAKVLLCNHIPALAVSVTGEERARPILDEAPHKLFGAFDSLPASAVSISPITIRYTRKELSLVWTGKESNPHVKSGFARATG